MYKKNIASLSSVQMLPSCIQAVLYIHASEHIHNYVCICVIFFVNLKEAWQVFVVIIIDINNYKCIDHVHSQHVATIFAKCPVNTTQKATIPYVSKKPVHRCVKSRVAVVHIKIVYAHARK